MTFAEPKAFDALAETTAAALGIRSDAIRRDYFLTRCLYAAAAASEGSGRLFAADRNRRVAEGVCVFGGGTSLVSAWDITRRYSQDLDLLVLMGTDTHKEALVRPHQRITELVADACGVRQQAIKTQDHLAAGFRRHLVEIAGSPPMFLMLDSTIEDSDDSLFASREITSLMGRYATEQQRFDFPELGGFSLPCVVPAYTAANKFDALHRRARKPDTIAARGRDLYDLACIAASEHADETRRRIRGLARRASDSNTRSVVLRPPGGYGRSDAFRHGSRANRALQAGYQEMLGTLWRDAEALSFDEAVKLAASLDLE